MAVKGMKPAPNPQ